MCVFRIGTVFAAYRVRRATLTIIRRQMRCCAHAQRVVGNRQTHTQFALCAFDLRALRNDILAIDKRLFYIAYICISRSVYCGI